MDVQEMLADHEHVDQLGLIHMNGRAYDPLLGRFLSVDPFIQFPMNSQSLNPYSYILNSPLAGSDPTGYMSHGINCAKRIGCNAFSSVAISGLGTTGVGGGGNGKSTTSSASSAASNPGAGSSPPSQAGPPPPEMITTGSTPTYDRIEVFADGRVAFVDTEGNVIRTGKNPNIASFLGAGKGPAVVYTGGSSNILVNRNSADPSGFYTEAYGVLAVAGILAPSVLSEATSMRGDTTIYYTKGRTNWRLKRGGVKEVHFNSRLTFKGQSPASGLLHEIGHSAFLHATVRNGGVRSFMSYLTPSNDVTDAGEQLISANYETLWVNAIGERIRENYSKPSACKGHSACEVSVDNVWEAPR